MTYPNVLTIPETVTHIRRVEGRDPQFAQAMLRTALAEDFALLYWVDGTGGPDRSGPFKIPPDPYESPPRADSRWLAAEIDFEAGTVLEFGLPEGRTPRRRVLLIHRGDVFGRWRDRAAEAEAEARREETTRTAARDAFDAVFWPLSRVLRWLAWRDPAMIETGWRPAALYRRTSASGVSLRLAEPRPILLRALQKGEIKAIRNGVELPPEFWSRTKFYDLPDDVDFRRDDVLQLWPAVEPSMDQKRKAYADRVLTFRQRDALPPLVTTKTGTLGDRDWAKQNGVSRSTVEAWREEDLPDRKRGRRRNSAGNWAKE